MQSELQFQYNCKGEPIKLWIIGSEEVTFLLDFLRRHFLKLQDNLEPKKKMKGTLQLGTRKVYQIEITNLPAAEWKLIQKDNLEVDALIFCVKKNLTDPSIWRDFKNWQTWGEVKVLLFIDPLGCPGDCILMSSNLKENVMQETLRGLLKRTQFAKKKVEPIKPSTRDL